jgi:ATP-dependent protease ClpP protease subunit
MAIPRLIIDKDIAAFDTFASVFGEPQPVFSANLVSDFLATNSTSTEIEVEIRSDGGSTTEAKIIYDLLVNSGKTITTLGYKVNSSAVIPFLAGSNRLISDNADFVIHPVWIDAYSLPWKLEAEDLQDFANEIKAEQTSLLNIYIGVIGEDKREEVTQLMADSTNLSKDKAISLGFATGSISAPNTENKRSLAFNNKMAEILNKSNSKQMTTLETLLKGLSNKVDKLMNMNTKNATAAIEGGGNVYYDGDLKEGVALFSDEAMTEKVKDGDIVMVDGKTVTVKDGVVSAITEKAVEPTNDTTALDAVNAKAASIESNQVAILEAVNKMADTITAMNTQVDKFKNLVPAANDTPAPITPQNKVDESKMTFAEKVASRVTNKNKN